MIHVLPDNVLECPVFRIGGWLLIFKQGITNAKTQWFCGGAAADEMPDIAQSGMFHNFV